MKKAKSHLGTLVTLLVLLLTVSSLSAKAEIYQWNDEAGIVHFSDTPPAVGKVKDVEIKSYLSPEVTPNNSNLDANRKVIMYGTSWCSVCKETRAYFKKHGIPFKEYDVEKSAKGRKDYRKMGGRGVPVILVGSKRLNGFNEQAFEAIYAEQLSSEE